MANAASHTTTIGVALAAGVAIGFVASRVVRVWREAAHAPAGATRGNEGATHATPRSARAAVPDGTPLTSAVIDAAVQKALQRQVAVPRADRRAYPPIKRLPSSQRQRVLVTGGAGFVGSHLVDRLMQQGHLVYVLDSLFTGRRRNIEHWQGHPHFQFFQGDVTMPFFLEVDRIYHLACPASPPQYQVNPIKTIKTSVLGTLNMLGLAKRTGARLLFTSTSEVYGNPLEHPQKESYWGNVNPIGPRSCYDEGKRLAETLCYSYQQAGFVSVRVARIFNTFGPRMHPEDGRVVSNFIIQTLQGKDITVYGDGEQTRSFQYVSDLVNGLMRLMESDYSAGPVNLGNPDETTINEFARRIKSMIPDSSSAVVHQAAATDDPCRRRPDITRAQEVLGWTPRVSVNEGLAKTIAYFREELADATATPSEERTVMWD